ncbi:MAG: hypothetical protein ABFD76_14895 [Smithella sp.]
MKVQWQLVDIKTKRAVIVGNDFELIDSMRESYFTGNVRIPWSESNMMFGHPTAIKNPIGILNALKNQKEKPHG